MNATDQQLESAGSALGVVSLILAGMIAAMIIVLIGV